MIATKKMMKMRTRKRRMISSRKAEENRRKTEEFTLP
jgi:hypothetical protein